eukprot:1563232-Pyramimonas_sp.AAC.1
MVTPRERACPSFHTYKPRDHEGHTYRLACKWSDASIAIAGRRRTTNLPRDPRERLHDEPTA